MTADSPALTTFVVLFAGLFGLVIGSFLNVVAYRVPAGMSIVPGSRCPNCGAPIKPWQNVPVLSWIALRGKCAECSEAISPRYPIVELVTGVSFALIAWVAIGISTGSITRLGSNVGLTANTASAFGGGADSIAFWLVLVAFLYFSAISIVLTLIDLDTKRLPNAIVLPSYVVAVILFAAAATLTNDWAALVRAGAGMVILYAFYFLLRVIRPGGMGGGDVKLAGVVGIYLGWLGWGALIIGSFAAFVLGGLFGIGLMVFRKAGRKTAIPFGPWMLAGAWVGIFFGQPIANWYVGMLTGT
ncbi:prepilin peptidase [Microbacterium rhizosphaerae]|uniref:Prepilin leader peptidase/N-methyltransferase n=1 Tax=Microbacterium rhizosphaerae TaxID=1678237 RepID=A0ABZ0SQX2_9MICO|nr:prepilin peptidase [Microbacterium rhizosphaerae]WPR91150.1 prepilin peptidase [Microbacterium rhizosphaerae]